MLEVVYCVPTEESMVPWRGNKCYFPSSPESLVNDCGVVFIVIVQFDGILKGVKGIVDLLPIAGGGILNTV